MAAGAASRGLLEKVSFDRIPGWRTDRQGEAFEAFRLSAERLRAGTGEGALQCSAALAAVADAALSSAALHDRAARSFFEAFFTPFAIRASGLVTGYYEPELPAGRRRSDAFPVPLYRRPPEAFPGTDGLPDRAAIEDGALAGLGLELVFLADPVDAFFVHVQGSARLRLDDGTMMRVGFDGRSGHPYTSIGRLAVERGLLPREHADKEGLEGWLRGNPARGRALMRENRSFVFFREVDGLGPEEGPLGSAGVPLVPGRSLAVDPDIVGLHLPVWVAAPALGPALVADCAGGEGFARLMVAHDTGSAIRGPARGDIFFGSGAEAGIRAGRVRHAATMVVLAPRSDREPGPGRGAR